MVKRGDHFPFVIFKARAFIEWPLSNQGRL